MSPRMQKLHFASSTYSASILRHCDVSIDDFVFDQDLQNKVYQRIASDLSNGNVNAFKKDIRDNASLLDETEEIPEEILRNFYVKIKSMKRLKQIIEAVLAISVKNTEKQSDTLINSFLKDAVYERLWNIYKHTDKELKDKEASQAEGNHVRHVVKPLEKRLQNMEIEQRKMKANLEAKLESMEKLLLKLAEK